MTALQRIHLFVALSMLAIPVRAQQLASIDSALPSSANRASSNAAVAVRAKAAPVLDGKDDDEIWQDAQVIDGFRQFAPTEDAAARFRTVAKIAFDGQYLYVIVRAYDPHPDSIIGLLGRRDVRTPSDWIKVMIDSNHDRRTGYSFAVNPRGVKRDIYIWNDTNEDESWDGVWDAATRVDGQGWVAEFRIPFSQLRFPRADEHVFGIMIWRDIARFNERDSWPSFFRSRPGIASQFGVVSGIRGLSNVRHLEVTPYALAKSASPTDPGYGSTQSVTGGADLKYGVTSNVTLDATINPDFGQVELDPAVLNLSAFETFFPERRPFFLEGAGIYRFQLGCTTGGFGSGCNELFYSRRIGRVPSLYLDDPLTPLSTQIMGAAKLSGELGSGLSLGFIDALTRREQGGATGLTAEAQANYMATRLQQDFRGGLSGIGLMFTGVNRNLDTFSSDSLHKSAYALGADFRHRWDGGNYELAGYLAGSRVGGSESAIARTQTDSRHYFQHPDGAEPYDPTRTSLDGDAEHLQVGKIGGGVLRYTTGYTRISPGFEVNDLGFLNKADIQEWSNYVGFAFNQPSSVYRQLFVDFGESQHWSTKALDADHLTDIRIAETAHMELPNSYWFSFTSSFNNFIPSYDDRDARGGPAVRRSIFVEGATSIEGDPRERFAPSLGLFGYRGSGGRSYGWGVDPLLIMRLSSSFTAAVGPHYDRNDDDHQWVDNFDHTVEIGSTRHDTSYTFAHLHQYTMALTARMDMAMTPRLSLQVYAQPFISNGVFSNWRELNDPRAADYEARYKPYGAQADLETYNFDDFEFRSNVVLRWEYRPGSTLFLVWQQGRSNYDEGTGRCDFDFQDNVHGLFQQHPGNTFLVKMSYWFNP